MINQSLKKFVIFFVSFLVVNSLNCGENEIEGCNICDSGINSSKCKKCEEKNFLALEGEICIKCDDSLLGMSGCDGNCEIVKSEKNVKCEEDKCKEGFYEINPGTCAICSFLFPHCKKCSYEKNYESDENKFKCLECEDKYYLALDNKACNYCRLSFCNKCLNNTFCLECSGGHALYPNGTCSGYISFCKNAIYSEEKNKEICIECSEGYALYPNGTCSYYGKNCKKAKFFQEKGIVICSECEGNSYLYPNGTCDYGDMYCKNRIYSNEKNKSVCLECKEKYYIDKNDNCFPCSDYQYDYGYKDFTNCIKCHSENNRLLCDAVKDGYYFSYSKEYVYQCSSSISKCEKCSYHSELDYKNNILKCDKCRTGYYISSDEMSCKLCKDKGNGCKICSDNEDQIICDLCASGYILKADGSCLNCKENYGEGCSSCSLSIFDLSPYCTKCNSGYTLGNDGKCKHCKDDANLIGCNSCQPFGNKGFYCISCDSGYVLKDGKCILLENDDFKYCKEIKNIGTENEPINSCTDCHFYNYIFSVKDNGAKDCVEPLYENDLYKCSSSRTENIGKNNYTCTKCNSDYKLEFDESKNKEICKSCIKGYYKSGNTNNFYCYSCSNKIYKCNECHKDDNDIVCDACDKGYLLTKNNQCVKCPEKCKKCSEDENSNIICDEYKIPFFLNNKGSIDSCLNYINNCAKCSYSNLNDGNLICDKCLEDYFKNKDGLCEHCYINTNIGSACISCTDDEELKKISPCQKCNGNNYFLTKENNCIYCNSIEYGGSECSQCGYIEINGNQQIGCTKCNNILSRLTIDGKCLELYESNCKSYGPYTNENNETIYGCTECVENYYLTNEHKCQIIKDIDGDTGNEINNYQNYLESMIEGCSAYSYKYDSYYCIECGKNYSLNQGFCIKKISNPFLENCRLTYSVGGPICDGCKKGSSIYLGKTAVCKNSHYGDCSNYENLGTDFVPLYSCSSCNSDTTTVIYENGIKKCSYNIMENRCSVANINTNYYTDIYTCIKCKSLYILSYSDYYEKKVCKYIYEDNIINNISIYDSDTGIPTINGICNENYFTRNGKICIKCDDEKNGMPGCGGKCTFKLNREYQLQCEENKCKDNYFETLPGRCYLCRNVITGCQNCKYIINGEQPAFQPLRKRSLICIKCDDDLFLYSGKCLPCETIFPGCKRCVNENNQIKCAEISNGYYFDKEGILKQCQPLCEKCSLINKDGKDKLICEEVSYSKYYIDSNGNPSRCESFCEECSLVKENGVEQVKCSKAYNGYYIDTNGKVKECDKNCEECELIKENGIDKSVCIKANYHYFINEQKEVIKCSDEKKGIIGCSSCELDTKLKCIYCSDGYEKVDDRCKSIEELYNLEGCLRYRKNNDKYLCTLCNENYLLIKNLFICMKKTEDLKSCDEARAIKAGVKTFYNCTSCKYPMSLVQNKDGYFKCFDLSKIKSYYCNKYINIGTFKDPLFQCDSCSYIYNYPKNIDEYGNSDCSVNYNFPYCSKMNKIKYLDTEYTDPEPDSDYYYEFRYKYNCTECISKYALEYDNYKKINKCTPLECGVPFCKKCSDYDVYNCQECFPGYTFNKLGYCYIKPKIAPTITFKDIFRFALNGLVEGSNIFSFSFYLRGLTPDKINEKHSFIISSVFTHDNGILRNLEEESIETSCEFESQSYNNNDTTITYVDYKCNLNSDKDLIDDYKMDSIKEGEKQDNENLKAVDLDNLVNNIDNINKYDSIFDNNELNKYILFTVDNNSKHFEENNFNDFNFIIYGITNKRLENNLKGFLTFSNTDNEKANCEIDAKDKDNALMNCKTNISKIILNKQNLILNFKEQEMKGDNNSIYFIGLNDIEIINLGNKEKDNINNKGSEGMNFGLMVGLAVGLGVFIIILLIVFVVFVRKKKMCSENNKNINVIPCNQNIQMKLMYQENNVGKMDDKKN